jgi:hypothetical protein
MCGETPKMRDAVRQSDLNDKLAPAPQRAADGIDAKRLEEGHVWL